MLSEMANFSVLSVGQTGCRHNEFFCLLNFPLLLFYYGIIISVVINFSADNLPLYCQDSVLCH